MLECTEKFAMLERAMVHAFAQVSTSLRRWDQGVLRRQSPRYLLTSVAVEGDSEFCLAASLARRTRSSALHQQLEADSEMQLAKVVS